MNTFTINGVVYTAKEFDFNMVCDLEDMGIALDQANKKMLSTSRAYFAICAGITSDEAGLLLQAHVVNGGSFESLMEAMAKEMDNSGFFRLSIREQRRKLQRYRQRRKLQTRK